MNEDEAPSALEETLRWPNLRSAMIVALVVGSLLNLINQGDVLLQDLPIDWLKLGLTYCVPFCVALYGAYSANRLRRRD